MTFMAKGKATLVFSFDSAADAASFQNAISPETQDIPDTKMEISMRGKEVGLQIATQDTPTLRAGVKSYMQWAYCALGMQRIAGGSGIARKE